MEVLEKRYAAWLPPEVEFKITWTTFDEYLKEEEKDGLGANVAHMVGHGAVRVASMGYDAGDLVPSHVASALRRKFAR